MPGVGELSLTEGRRNLCLLYTSQQKKCRQTDGGSRVPSRRLGDDLLCRELPKLTQNGGAQIIVRNYPETTRRSHGRKARDGLLNHGLLAIKRKQLLGAALAAQRPKARASPTGEDYGIEVWILGHSVDV